MSRTDELAKLAKEGNQEAFTDLVEILQRRLETLAAKIVPHNPSLQEDLYADAVFSLPRSVDKWNESKGKFATFAMTVARREMYLHLRVKKRQGEHISMSTIEENSLPFRNDPEDMDIEDFRSGTDACDVAIEAARSLSPSQQQLINLVLQGASLPSIAVELGISEEEAKLRLKAAANYISFEVGSKCPDGAKEIGLHSIHEGSLFDELDDVS
ncbi:MAG: hypothetical protein CMK32_08040 [Porticoccaceae bacterium]|nr:hypothetical protein [Porticoccaceae bacterium]